MNQLIHGNLTEDVVAFCDKAIIKIKEIREASDRPLSPNDLFEMSQFLHSFRAWLTSHILTAEAQYRDRAEEYRNYEGMSVAAADTKAKATPEYRAWRYLSRVDDLASEQVLLVSRP
jgi:hypothetical protein